ncbi:hypothetical protein CASFOL_030760 [Castilleja foliolosa]|uniref:KH type-2 domain-containing protein n=1 Tax=Castilleja foliolosa TaxID=1961234 RepID=A0ABD3C7J7_9LAMI
MATQMSKKRKFVADGVFFAELNELFTRELAEDGYSGVEVRVTPMRTEIIIRATRTQNVLGEKGRRIRELTSVVQKRFKFPENSVELYAEKVNNRGLCAIAQAESLRYKLLGGLAVRRACYGVLRFVMESGAKGCEVIVSGKLRAQRAKAMKFKDGYMISSGQPVNEYIDSAVRHVLLRQGVLGIKVKIMLDWDPKGKQGPTTPLPDLVTIHPPKEEEFIRPASIVPTEVEWGDQAYPTVANCKTNECPSYTVVHSQNEFEIRSYKEAAWVSGPKIPSNSYKTASNEGFLILFSYIQGNNKERVKINMTIPVFVEVKYKTYTTFFYVPQKYQSGTPLPEPISSDVTQVKIPKQKYAAVRRFDGVITDDKLPTEFVELKKGLQGTPYQRAAAFDSFIVAGYNSPFEPFDLVNEIIIFFN